MIVATMASLSSRVALLRRTVDSLVDQVDVLCVYLNGHRRIPSCLRHPKVAWAVLSSEHGIRGGEAKLLFWDRAEWKAPPYWDDDDIAIIVDDDIQYPPDYVDRHVDALERRPGTISCVHGSILLPGFTRWRQDRYTTRLGESLAEDTRVHIPGAGTMAFRRGDFDVSLRRDQRWSHCVDIMTALAAKEQGVEVWSLAREAGWLHHAAATSGTVVYRLRTGGGNDAFETRAVLDAGPWPELAAHGVRPAAGAGGVDSRPPA